MVDSYSTLPHSSSMVVICFFFNDTATTEIYTLSLHDALPICRGLVDRIRDATDASVEHVVVDLDEERKQVTHTLVVRSEEHTSELQSRQYLVCRLLLEKKKKKAYRFMHSRM